MAKQEKPTPSASPIEDAITLTRRDRFAMAAIFGVIATCRNDHDAAGRLLPEYFAEKSYEIADAMEARRTDK